MSEAVNNRISVVTRQGAFVHAFDKDVVPGNAETGFEVCAAQSKGAVASAGPGQLKRPGDLALDCRDALYVAELLNARVRRFGEPGTASPPCDGASGPSSAFRIVSTEPDPTSGTAKLVVTVPRAGTLAVEGALIKRSSKQVRNSGTAQLQLHPTPETMRRLNERGTASVRAVVTYTRTDGSPRTKTRDIELPKEPGS